MHQIKEDNEGKYKNNHLVLMCGCQVVGSKRSVLQEQGLQECNPCNGLNYAAAALYWIYRLNSGKLKQEIKKGDLSVPNSALIL